MLLFVAYSMNFIYNGLVVINSFLCRLVHTNQITRGFSTRAHMASEHPLTDLLHFRFQLENYFNNGFPLELSRDIYSLFLHNLQLLDLLPQDASYLSPALVNRSVSVQNCAVALVVLENMICENPSLIDNDSLVLANLCSAMLSYLDWMDTLSPFELRLLVRWWFVIAMITSLIERRRARDFQLLQLRVLHNHL